MRSKLKSGDPVRRRVRVLIGAVVGALLLTASVTWAQKREPPTITLSTAQQVEKGTKYMAEMKETLARAFDQLKQARSGQDIGRLNCVNEALSAIKGLMRLSEQNYMMLQEASAKKDAKTAEHEFVKLTIAYNKIKELDGRVQSCGRPSASGEIDGRPTIDRIKDADLPEEDPLDSLQNYRADLDRPPSASPLF